MSIEQKLLEVIRWLPREKQLALLEFAESLKTKNPESGKLPSVKGLCADLGVDVPGEAIDELRRELWAGFPREDVA